MRVDRVVIHCSDSTRATVEDIDGWHRARGFDRIGYHWVITNGHLRSNRRYIPEADGRLWPGRSEDETGAHVEGHNRNALGVCLVGKTRFSTAQRITLHGLLIGIMSRHGLSDEDILGHYELDPAKTCPNIAMSGLRDTLSQIKGCVDELLVC